MKFMNFLQGIGDRFGILESVSTPDSVVAARIQTRIVSLQELAIEIRSVEVRALADSPAELATPFAKIFEAAGISSKPGDWTTERLKTVIQAETEKKKSRGEVQKAILDLLNSEGVSADIIVKDAIARDQALDAYEARVNQKLRERTQAVNKRLMEIEAQIKALRDESARISANLEADEIRWREWKKEKRAQEHELASVAGYLVDHPVVTTDEEDLGESP